MRYWIEINGSLNFDSQVKHQFPEEALHRYLDIYELGPRGALAIESENRGSSTWPPAQRQRMMAVAKRSA